MITQNFPASVKHFFNTLEDQVEGLACKIHGGNCFGRKIHDGCCSCNGHEDIDLGMLGTPCQPFSRQRVKRSQAGSVKGHGKYLTTFRDLIQFLKTFEPRTAVLEQVAGIDTPESTIDRRTPLQRSGMKDQSDQNFSKSGTR